MRTKSFITTLLAAGFMFCLTGSPSRAIDSEVLGSTDVDLPGDLGLGTTKLSYVSLQLLEQAAAEGSVTSLGASTLTDSNAAGDWANDQFNGANGPHFVEITGGNQTGAVSEITDTTGASGTLTTGDDLSALAPMILAGDPYVVRPHVILGVLLPGGGGLTTNADVNLADNVLLVNANGTTTDFYHNGANWVESGPETNADNQVVMPEAGMIFRNRAAGTKTVTFTGAAKRGPTVVPVESGFNLLGTLKAANPITLAALNLFTGDPNTGVAPGQNPTEADNLIVIEPNGTASRYFFIAGVGGVTDGWYDATYTNSDAVAISPGSAFFLQRKNGAPAFAWTVPAEP